MKIKQLDIKGFRSLKDVSWQPGDLNVVIGQNGSGKSNLLRVLEMISASAQGKLSKHIQTSGGMDAIVWDGSVPSISINLELWDPNIIYGFEMIRLGTTSSYSISNETLIATQVEGSQEPLIINYSERKKEQSLQEKLIESLGHIPQEEILLGIDVLPDKLHPPPIRIRRRLVNMTVFHDVNVSHDSKLRQAVIARYEKKVEPDGQNLVAVLHTLYTGDREFKHNIDSAMCAAFGSDFEELVFPPAADQRVQLRVRWRTLRREQSAADLSDGTLRFLLLLSILAGPDPPMLIAIDEPETGLHPAMFPIIAEFAVEASARAQIVFTTHSPQFLDAFTKIKPTTTVATWANGETSLHTLEGEALDYWLKDYSLGVLFESGQLEAMT
jgi:predicted ATPase